jgi:hypothetical protein
MIVLWIFALVISFCLGLFCFVVFIGFVEFVTVCCYAFVVCSLVEILYNIDINNTGWPWVELSTQDLWNNLGRQGEEGEKGLQFIKL